MAPPAPPSPASLPPRRGRVVRTLPPARRGRPRGRRGRDGAGRRARTAPGRPACSGSAPGWCRWPRAGSSVLGLDPVRHRTGSAGGSGCSPTPPTSTTISPSRENVRFAVRAAGARHRADRRRLRPAGADRPPGQDQRRQALRRPAAPGGPGRAGRPLARAVAARRAPRRPRRLGPGASSTSWSPRPPPPVSPWCIASHEPEFGRVAGRPGGGHHRGPGDRRATDRCGGRPAAPSRSTRPTLPAPGSPGRTGRPCGVTPSWWPARTSASRPGPGWRCPRWHRSGSWPWSCSPSPSGPTAP